MAITSISRLQHRRGLKTDLPANLYEGELGWCIDTRELFIGNGPTTNGNSQLLSQWSQNDQLITHSFVGSSGTVATTGSDPNVPVVRTLGAIIDDWISVKDYGAVGDGVTDDTAAIQRAITDRWTTMSPGSQGLAAMSGIRFPAGNYLITSPLNLLPMVALVGEGSGRTVITMGRSINAPACVIRTADSLGQIGTDIGTYGATMPGNNLIQGIGFDASSMSTVDGIWLQRASNIMISDVAVMGAWQPGQNPISLGIYPTKGILIQTLGTAVSSDGITIRDYAASNLSYGIYCNDPVRYITVDRFDIDTCFQGAIFDSNAGTLSGGPSYVRMVNGSFRNIDYYGLYVNCSNPGVVSSNNAYDTVGDAYSTWPIFFSPMTSACSSINDVFSVQGRERVYIGNPAQNILISPQQVSIASNQPITFGPFVLQDNASMMPTGISFDTTQFNTFFISYSMSRTTGIGNGTAYRAGMLTVITDGVSIDFDDQGLDLNPVGNGVCGVTWSANVVSGTANINYSTTSTGYTGNLYCIETTWQTT